MQITHFPKRQFNVSDHRVLTPSGPADFPALSQAKMQAARTAEFTYHAINANLANQQHYLVETADDCEQFSLPAGDYASFSMTRGNRLALDQFIGQAYGQIAQSGYHPAGNYNLETLSDATFTIEIPVAAN